MILLKIRVVSPKFYICTVAISGDVWTFTLYHIHDINLEMKIDSESPTGERYEFVSAAVDYVIEKRKLPQADSYFITNTYGTCFVHWQDLATVNKNSFIDAVNENAKKYYRHHPKPKYLCVCDGDHDELKVTGGR